MEQGLIDIRNKARELSKKFGELSPYYISCGTLIAILDDLEAAQQPCAVDLPCTCACGDLIPPDEFRCLNCQREPANH